MTKSLTDELFDAITAVEGCWSTGDLDTEEMVRLWVDTELALRQLGLVLKLISDDASSKLLDRDDPLEDYVTQVGDVVHLERGYATERWAGRALIHELATTMATRDGELVPAVPVEVLTDVLPGCFADDQTSSRWRTTGLTRHMGKAWYRYRSKELAPLVIKRGEARR